MILEVKKYPDPILRKKCDKVQEITEEIRNLAQDMLETMITKEGVGLAAPQVGKLLRIIVVRFEDGPKVFINPQILNKSKETKIMEEGCLSFPDLFLKIKRAKLKIKREKWVEVEALNINGEKIQIKAEGLSARVFQHEIDHLDGILFIDRIGFWERLKFKFTLLNPPKAVSR